MFLKVAASLIGFVIFCISPLHAANRDVCATCPYTTIADAMTAAADGDTVRVASGSYSPDGIWFQYNGVARDIRVEGGWNETFSERNPTLNHSTISWVSVAPNNRGAAEVDGFWIMGGGPSGVGVQMDTSTSDLIVSNSRIFSFVGDGIYIESGGTILIEDNEIYSNCSGQQSGGGGIVIGKYRTHAQATIRRNHIYGHTCQWGAGVMLWNANSNDSIENNLLHDNQYGVSIYPQTAASTSTISSNITYANTDFGIYMQGGSSIFRNNVSYDNKDGIRIKWPTAPSISNNTLTSNSEHGLYLEASGTDKGVIVENNIISANPYGLYIDSHDFVPTARYNLFFSNPQGDVVHTSLYPWLYTSEVPGGFGDINSLQAFDYNMILDPHFVDTNARDFHLSESSFAIDAGNPSSPYGNEPELNGDRINLGAYGGTNFAETSPDALSIIGSVRAYQDGSSLVAEFSTTSTVDFAWLSLEYWNGSAYQVLPVPTISGASSEKGYRGWRIATGADRSLRLEGVASTLQGQVIPAAKLRLTLEYGNRSLVAESDSFEINFPAPTPTVTATHTETPRHATTATETPTPTPTETATTTSTTIPTHTAVATVTATGTSTASPTPMDTSTAIPLITPTPTATLPLPTPSPTSTPAVEPTRTAVAPLAPRVTALATIARKGKTLKLRCKIRDDDSQNVTIELNITRRSRQVVKERFSLVPSQNEIRLKPKKRLTAKGEYRFCLRAQDESRLRSRKSCARLSVT